MYSASHHRPSHVSRPSNHRARSSSDPFSDPVYPAPHIAYNSSYPRDRDRERDRERTYERAPPPPPPKSKHHQHASSVAHTHKKSHHHRQLTDREPMVDVAIPREPLKAERAKVSRSQTGGVQSAAIAASRNPAPTGRRSYSQDSATPPTVMKVGGRAKSGKKGSSAHADVIDRLDFTSTGLFHHDGPFDACAPSRNRHKAKAPMMAWSAPEDDGGPMSAAAFRAQKGMTDSTPYDVAYDDHYGGYMPRDHKQVDRIAEAWGVHEPEPYEEFFGGGGGAAGGDASAASSIRGGYEAHIQNPNGRGTRHQLRETYTSEAPPVRKTTTRVPPPEPLDLPGSGARGMSMDASIPSPPLSGSPGAPKRSKSLMQKIRRMRDQPNVPVENSTPIYNDGNPSPPSSTENYGSNANEVVSDGERRTGRPSHRHQNSFFGRLAGRTTSANPGLSSPTSDVDNHYVYVEKHAGNAKALPPRPMETPIANSNEKESYFDSSVSAPAANGIPSSPNGVTRKTSILKKVKGAVRGGR